ncbi:MAG: hypothetical protein HN849_11895 [Victivallales bacterium]|jgi:hypothetical protein|nr:hypothetical protein [Victivallales bacterium]
MPTSINLKDGAAQYIEHLEAIGKKPSTVGTARRTMDLFVGHLGEGKEVAKILPVHVAGFFKSEAATTLNEKPRAKASILQIRRIVRSALVFWHEQGLLDNVPLPKTEKKFLEPRKDGKARAEANVQSADAQPEATTNTKQEVQE